jgi:four helix bundle protein
MTSQLRRAAVSILANLAEGFGRYTYADKAHKFTISRGESTEIEALLLICIALKLATEKKTAKSLELTRRVGKMLSGLINASKNQHS